MNKDVNSDKRGKPSDITDIKKLIEVIEDLSEKIDKNIKLQEKLFLLEQKKLIRENLKNS